MSVSGRVSVLFHSLLFGSSVFSSKNMGGMEFRSKCTKPTRTFTNCSELLGVK